MSRQAPLANATSLKELVHAEWITTSITPRAESEIGDLFKRYGLPDPMLALQSQSALTLLTCLANSDLLGTGAVGGVTLSQPDPRNDPGEGRSLCSVHHRRYTIGSAFGSRCHVPA